MNPFKLIGGFFQRRRAERIEAHKRWMRKNKVIALRPAPDNRMFSEQFYRTARR